MQQPGAVQASIVIAAPGGAPGLSGTLAALRELPDAATREVILVLDPGSPAPEDAVPPVDRVVRSEQALSFLDAVNLGAESAGSEILVVLAAGALVQPGWLDALTDTLNDPTIGQAGSLILSPPDDPLNAAPVVEHGGGIIFRDGNLWNYGRRRPADAPEVRTFRDVDYCALPAFAIRTALFRQTGGFDPRFAPAHYEDADLSMSVRAKGFRTVIQPRSVVIQQSAGDRPALNRFVEPNRLAFLAKWREELRGHGDLHSLTDVWRGRYRTPRGMLALCDADVPMPDRESGSRRMMAIIDQLQDMGYAVYLLPGNHRAAQPYTEQLAQRSVTVLADPSLQDDFLRHAGPGLAAAFVSRPSVANMFLRRLFEHAPNATLLYDTVDLHALRLKREAIVKDDQRLARIADHEWQLERTAIELADVTFVVSGTERELLGRLLPDVRVEVLSNIHESVVHQATPADRSGMVFVGNFQHNPNVDAAIWFVEQVLPVVRAAQPDAVLRIVGPHVPAEVKALAGPGVQILGWVPDLGPIYAAARVVVAPMRFGAGVKGKVAEALEHAVPVVGTSIALEAMGLEHEVHVLQADDAPAFADAVITLLADDEVWQGLSGAGQSVLDELFSPAAARRVLDEVLPADRQPRLVPLTEELAAR